jgi:hypothetical protein
LIRLALTALIQPALLPTVQVPNSPTSPDLRSVKSFPFELPYGYE